MRLNRQAIYRGVAYTERVLKNYRAKGYINVKYTIKGNKVRYVGDWVELEETDNTKLRKSYKLTQRRLAQLTNMSQPTIIRWEQGKSKPETHSVILNTLKGLNETETDINIKLPRGLK